MAKSIAKRPKEENKKESREPEPLTIRADAHISEGKYCNLAIIRHTPNEFIFDFVFAIQGEGQLVSRVQTSPQHAKKILDALGENIKGYEKQFGPIFDKESIPS